MSFLLIIEHDKSISLPVSGKFKFEPSLRPFSEGSKSPSSIPIFACIGFDVEEKFMFATDDHKVNAAKPKVLFPSITLLSYKNSF